METERRLLRLVRPYWGLLGAGLVITFLASVLDGFVLVVLIPLLKNLFGTAGAAPHRLHPARGVRGGTGPAAGRRPHAHAGGRHG